MQTVKTIKTFDNYDNLINYCIKINHPATLIELKKELNKNALIKYGSILLLFDPFNLLE